MLADNQCSLEESLSVRTSIAAKSRCSGHEDKFKDGAARTKRTCIMVQSTAQTEAALHACTCLTIRPADSLATMPSSRNAAIVLWRHTTAARHVQ